jgi:hypothetical protein
MESRRVSVCCSSVLLPGVRQNLIDLKGLIYSPRRGYVDFTAPLFGDYIRRHHPLELLQ